MRVTDVSLLASGYPPQRSAKYREGERRNNRANLADKKATSLRSIAFAC